MRRYYIDNLRSLVILTLIPFHTFRMFTAAEPFYVQGDPIVLCEFTVNLMSIWFMNLLFALAGMSTAYSLRKRTSKQYMKERVNKLLIPFIFGVTLTIPVQTYFAERFHNGYTGSYLHQYILFFTKKTDLTGYFGGFTPGHLWFLLFLFVISLLSLPVIIYNNGRKLKSSSKVSVEEEKSRKHTVSIPRLIPWFFVIYVASIVQVGEQLGQYMAYFLIGYYVLTKEEVLAKLKQRSYILILSGLTLCVITDILYFTVPMGERFALSSLSVSALGHLSSWITVLGMLGIGQKILDFSNRFTNYMARTSFSLYFVHQTLLVAIGYYIIPRIQDRSIAIITIIILGFLSSVIVVEVLRSNKVTSYLFGMKK